jgi:hypothetical protein
MSGPGQFSDLAMSTSVCFVEVIALTVGVHDVADDLPIGVYGTVVGIALRYQRGASAFCLRLLGMSCRRSNGLGEIERIFRSCDPADIFFNINVASADRGAAESRDATPLIANAETGTGRSVVAKIAYRPDLAKVRASAPRNRSCLLVLGL